MSARTREGEGERERAGARVTVGVYGGSFNPPHVAHVLAAAYVLSATPVERVLVVPTFQHPFGKALAPFEDRFAMCERAMRPLPSVTVSRVEQELGGASTTLRTLQHLARENPSWSMRLVIGQDIVAEAHKWHAFDAVERLAPPLVLGRVGFEAHGFVDAEGRRDVPRAFLPDVSSTEMRRLLARRGDHGGDDETLERLLPREVLAYLRARDLYRDRPADAGAGDDDGG